MHDEHGRHASCRLRLVKGIASGAALKTEPINDSKEQDVSQTASTAAPDRADELRAAMVQALREQDAIISEPVAAAVAAVPRHLFAPGESLENAYAPHGIVQVKQDSYGRNLSVMSAAHLQAVMLEQAAIEPGMRVLEVGSGGYNAALIQQLVGPSGHVTTVDIDPDVTSRAYACLSAAGYQHVQVVTADANDGVPDHAPFDRIIVTAGVWDLPPAWLAQMAADGRLVVPLRLRGLTRSIAFDWDGAELISRGYCLAAFVPVQGDGAYDERKVMLRDGIALQTDDPAIDLDAAGLSKALDSVKTESWPGAAWDMPDELDLFVSLNLLRTARLHASEQAIKQRIVEPVALRGVATLVDGDNLAYRLRRTSPSSGEEESGVVAFGPRSEELAYQYAKVLVRWSQSYRRRGAATFRYIPTSSAHGSFPAHSVIKHHGAVKVTWS
jgi:protein-L-isoaspartate(D-aspartate) O-methyltransferase